MQNVLTYHREAVLEHSGLVQDRPATYVERFNEKIDQYLEQLKDCESRCLRPGTDREAILDEVTVLTDSMLEACAQVEREMDDPLSVKNAQVSFRDRTHPMLSKSYCINRTRTWPNGQQGDFMTLELAYKNMPMSSGIGYYLDKYLLTTALGVGVRERVATLRDLLKNELLGRRDLKVLDIACGSCREVFELAQDIKTSGAKFTCVDLDPEALDFSLDRLTYAGLTADQADVRQYNALRMFDHETAQAEFGKQDVIYSIGFFDYLPDDFLVKLLSSLYGMLNDGGKLIAAFKDADRYRAEIFHWLVDWDGFLQRKEKDFVRLLRQAGIPDSALSMSRVDSGSIVFYTATKK